MRLRMTLAAALCCALMTGCPGKNDAGNKSSEKAGDTNTTAAAPAAASHKPLPSTPPNMTGEAPKPDLSKVKLPDGVTPEMVELGRQVWMGKAGGGSCYTCHGMDAKGSMLAPDQTDNEWLHGDGSYEAILATVKKGVPAAELKAAQAPMPPMGGANLDDQHLKAVAAYVYAISHSGN
ncbi:MAG: hypothetical protein D6776_06360 [Planctomycetota bacterium]|nr:MAG: hypothetical protein D6776_06360 [Planctomycetota bacterium]